MPGPDPEENLFCYINPLTSPDFIPTDVSPQVAFDTALPSTIQVHSFAPINAAAPATQLNVYNTSFQNPATLTAESIASNGSYATFPYPQGLPAEAYITTITTGSGTNLNTVGMEPFFIAHNDTSFTSAFGVDEAAPEETVTTTTTGLPHCGSGTTKSVVGGTPLPIVTLPTLGKLAVGSMSNLIPVGTTPTVVIAYNRTKITTTTSGGTCYTMTTTAFTGAQAALVVNTGSNNVSIVGIGQEYVPSATITVGSQPVAAAINSAETFAYVANYGSNTISEINLQTMQVSRTLGVQTHPTAVSFDASGNLWVSGQGFLSEINLTNWAVQNTLAIDGTVTGMTYDAKQNGFVAAVQKNGTATQPVNGMTMSAPVLFSPSNDVSYSTTAVFNTTTNSTTTLNETGDSAPYSSSPLASQLAFAGQTAFNPPTYTSTYALDDIAASASGNSFTIFTLSTGKVLLSGTTPYPIRGIKLTSGMLYMTMPESNSLITLPIQLP